MHVKPALPWLALALGIWAAGLTFARLRPRADLAPRPGWQHSFLELSQEGRREYSSIREGIYEAENRRTEDAGWPSPGSLAAQGIPPFNLSSWELRREGPYVNYLGEAAGLRWLVLFIEADPAERRLVAPGAPPVPIDEEHHTLSDGTTLHVTVWTQPTSSRPPQGVLSFPVAEGWVQRVGQ